MSRPFGTATAVIQELASFSNEELSSLPESRKKALDLSRRLTALLEDPVNTATQLVFSPYVATVARIAVDLDLFNLIRSHDGPICTETIAAASGGEALMITRFLRLLAAIGFVEEVSQDEWMSTPITDAMATSAIAAGHRFLWDYLITTAVKAPKFLRETGHCCPTQPTDGFVQYAHQTKLNTFDHLASIPPLLHDFNDFMGHAMGAKQYWIDWYPVEERLLNGMDPKAPLLVDIGGGRGHDAQAFCKKYPNSGLLVLQDLPQGLASIRESDLDPSVQRMAYSFFTEQPIKESRVYFLHHILHNWADPYCLKILSHIRAAMKPAYSKLLIHDLVLPDTGVNAYQSILDMTQMTFNGGMERSRTQWRRLLETVGFAVTDFLVPDPDADGIVEAIVAP